MLTTEQEWSQEFRPQAVQMVQKTQTLSFFGRRSFVPRPMSEATEIFDTDNEDENTDDGSGPQSMGSVCLLPCLSWSGTNPSYQLDNDSQTTVSTPDEIHTPNS